MGAGRGAFGHDGERREGWVKGEGEQGVGVERAYEEVVRRHD